MPAKRKGAETDFNLDPSTTDQSTPRKFAQMLAYQSRKAQPKLQPTARSGPQPKKTKLLTLSQGETMRDFSRRVDDTARVAINLAFRKTTKTKTKRAENAKSYKRAMKEKARASDEDGLDQLLERKAKEDTKVKFGEQAMAPPVLTVKPTVKAYMPKPRGDSSDEDLETTKEKVKLTLAQKRIMEVEREKAIQQYRLQKQRTVAIKLAAYEKKAEGPKSKKRKSGVKVDEE